MLFAITANAQSPDVLQTDKQLSDQSTALSSMEKLSSRIEVFFSEPHKLLTKSLDEDNPHIQYVEIGKYLGKDLSYDVKKTDSLVSPYTGYVKIKLTRRFNSQCSPMKDFWPSERDAIANAGNEKCYPDFNNDYGIEVRFIYAYQKNNWVLKDILQTYYGKTKQMGGLLTAIGMPAAGYLIPTDPDSVKFNQIWRETLAPSQSR